MILSDIDRKLFCHKFDIIAQNIYIMKKLENTPPQTEEQNRIRHQRITVSRSQAGGDQVSFGSVRT